MRFAALFGLAAAVLYCTAAQPAAAQPAPRGAITGTITDSRSGRPIAGALVSIQGTERRTTADAGGRFTLPADSGDSVTLRVAMIGYRPATRTARLGGAPLQITLEQATIKLDEVVVTGQAGAIERRAIGNSVAQVSAAGINQLAPAPDVSRLLTGRAAGVVLQSASGGVGSGGKVRIRGVSSLSLTNEPLIYVDGVRVDNAVGSGPASGGKPYISRLNDINPEQIESIEILRGPAAATLYGTEASNGVIQIITKKGVRGEPRLTLMAGAGTNWVMDPENRFPTAVGRNPDGTITSLNLVKAEKARGTPIFRTGNRQQYEGSVSGGTDKLQYFTSSGYETDEGALPNNRLRRLNGRGNLKVLVNDALDVAVNFGLVSGRTFLDRESGGISPLAGAYVPRPDLLDTPARGFFTGVPPEAIYRALTDFQDLSRTTAGVQVNHRSGSWLTQRLTVGTDVVQEENQTVTPRLGADIAPLFGATGLGFKRLDVRNVTNRTIDYGATAVTGPLHQLAFRTSFGAQYYTKRTHTNFGQGSQFPAPGVTTISAAAVITGGEDLIENSTVGVYAEQQVSWKDRLYLTAAVRADDNSAFGANFNLATYPKVSASWVVSEEPFWPKALASTFRLRGAFGQSGQQPDAFASLLTYEAVTGPGSTPAIRPQFLGNPELGPERGSELELGFEAAMLAERLGVDLTFYDKRTKDAILAKTAPPSLGFPGTQFVNVGEVKNRGLELQITGRPVDGPRANVELRFNFAHNTNEITDMAGVPPISLGVRNLHREGYPVGALFDRRVVSAELGANGRPTNLMCDGGPENDGGVVPCATAPRVFLGPITPVNEGSFSMTVTLGRRLSLYGLADFRYGHKVFDANIAILCIVSRYCQENVDPSTNIVRAAGYDNAILGSTIHDAGFTKLRQLSASYTLPDRWARLMRASGATVTITGRNLFTWTDYPGVDPELTDIIRGSEHFNQNQLQMPQLAQFLTQIRLSF
jgi:TonB-dependent SusC/RagA subfamily outer membrane receptor